jgi:type I restriction enzyme S subunit
LASLGGLVDHISSATIAHLTGMRLKSMEVIAPPLELQQFFGEQVKAVEAIQRRANMSLGSLEAFFASLQQRAFRGDL